MNHGEKRNKRVGKRGYNLCESSSSPSQKWNGSIEGNWRIVGVNKRHTVIKRNPKPDYPEQDFQYTRAQLAIVPPAPVQQRGREHQVRECVSKEPLIPGWPKRVPECSTRGCSAKRREHRSQEDRDAQIGRDRAQVTHTDRARCNSSQEICGKHSFQQVIRRRREQEPIRD